MQVRSLIDTEKNIKLQVNIPKFSFITSLFTYNFFTLILTSLFKIERELKRADALAKSEGTQTRVALIKLQKDYDRVKSGIQAVYQDAYAIEITKFALLQLFNMIFHSSYKTLLKLTEKKSKEKSVYLQVQVSNPG